MKRVLTFLLALVMLLSLAACGTDTPNSTDNNKNDGANDATNNVADKDPTTVPTTVPTTTSPYEAHAGKYLIYHVVSGTKELNYFQVSQSRLAGSYIELHADGKVSGMMNGQEVQEGITWDAETLTMTNFEGETNAISFQDNGLLFTVGSDAMTFLAEGDPRLEDLPTPYQYLHDYIVANGTQDETGHTVICSEDDDGEKYTMTAAADGKIFWDHFEADGTKDIHMELVQDAQFQTIIVIYNDYVCTTTVETATITDSGFALASCEFDPVPQFGASSIQNLVEMEARLLFMKANRYLSFTVGISMDSLGFTNYSLF